MDVDNLQKEYGHLKTENDHLKELLLHRQSTSCSMTVSNINYSKIKGLFKFYTGFCFVTFNAILQFLIPVNTTVNEVIKPVNSCCAFKTMPAECRRSTVLNKILCKLRNAFAFKDLSFRFGVLIEDASLLFKNWINLMYFKFTEVSICPNHYIIIKTCLLNSKKIFQQQ